MATRIIPGLGDKKYSYEDRLQICNLPSLKFRGLRGDMIETYKIINGKYDKKSAPHFPLGGNDLRINTCRTKYDIRKHFFY